MSQVHDHHHLARASGAGDTLDEALSNAVAGVTDPQGHHRGVVFDAFEVIKITGAIDHQSGDYGKAGRIRVQIEATGHHNV